MMIVMIMGIMLSAFAKSWTMIMKREREEELLFRGGQIRDAIARWNKPAPGQHAVTPLRDLKDLLNDPRSLTTVRYLRKLYKDPITNNDFAVIIDPSKGIIGVRSTSDKKPVRQSFKSQLFRIDNDHVRMYQAFEGKEKYSEWAFIYIPQP